MIQIDIEGGDYNLNETLIQNILTNIREDISIDQLVCNSLIQTLSKKPTDMLKETYRKVKTKGEMCVICMDEMKETEYYRQLDCKHRYHRKCIDKWINKYNNYYCPICKDNPFMIIHQETCSRNPQE